jgi:hypothetical protein
MATPDPNQPGYRPDAHTDRNLGDVGHGDDFGLDLYDMYSLGRVHYPDLAEWYSDMVEAAEPVSETLGKALNGTVYRQAHQDLVNLHSELQFALYKGWQAYAAVGPALVTIVDDYLATDEAARDAFNEKYSEVPETGEDKVEHKGFDHPATPSDPPPRPGPPEHTGVDSDPRTRTGGPQE